MKKDIYKKEFFQLIEDISFLRSIHKQLNPSQQEQIQSLEDEATKLLFTVHDIQEGIGRVKVAVIGGFSSGKSSFINSLLGRDICPVGVGATTSSITTFFYGESPQIIRKDQDNERFLSEEEYKEIVQHPKTGAERGTTSEFHYYYPFEGLRNIELVDTPGFDNKQNPRDTEITLEATRSADSIFFILDANTGEISDSVEKTLNRIKKESPAEWYAIINKADGKTSSGLEKIKNKIQQKYSKLFSGKNIFIYSAKEAIARQEKNIERTQEHIFQMVKTEVECIQNETPPSPEAKVLYITITSEKKTTTVILQSQHYSYGTFQIYSPTRNFGKSREELIDTLRDIGQKKQVISFRNYNASWMRYEDSFEKIMRELQSQNKKLEQSMQNSNNLELLLKKYEDFIEQILSSHQNDVNNLTYSLFYECFSVKSIPKERRDYWIYPDFEVILELSNKFDSVWKSESNVWLAFKAKLEQLREALRDDLAFELDIKEDEDSLVFIPEKQAMENAINTLNEIEKKLKTYYNSEEEAYAGFIKVKDQKIEYLLNSITAPSKYLLEKIKKDISEHIGFTKGRLYFNKNNMLQVTAEIHEYLKQRNRRI